jgi:hypothetical protein
VVPSHDRRRYRTGGEQLRQTGTIAFAAYLSLKQFRKKEKAMTIRFALVIASVAGICIGVPAYAEEVGVGVGPVGVTVGAGHEDRDRDADKKVIIKKHEDETGVSEKKVIIKKDHDRDHD